MTTRTVQLLSISLFLGLLTWGIWVFLYYLGVPVHTAVLLPQEAQATLGSLCDPNAFVCRGVYSLFPFLSHTLTRVPFFIWYTVVSVVVFGLALVWGYIKNNRFNVSWSITPWKMLLLFVSMTWLLFTCLSLSSNGDMAFRNVIEPHPQVYQTSGPEALENLQRNYDRLKDAGCLRKIGTFAGVTEASEMKFSCLQSSFFRRVLPPALVLLLFVFEFLVAGRFVLRKALKLLPKQLFTEFVVSLGLGAGVWIVLLWLGALLGIYTNVYGWALALLVLATGFKDARYWLEQFFIARWEVSEKWNSVMLVALWALLSYLFFNYINVIRPFPIGWDDLGSYLNRPRLLVSYGQFVHSMASFQWEYITSLGFLLFGFESVFGATTSLVLNWFQGVLAILVIILFGRTFIGKGKGIVSALLYYTLPLVGHFSFADMKIDNAVFAYSALGAFCLFYALFSANEEQRDRSRWVLLAGGLIGLAFSIKITSIMMFMALAAVLAGATLHWTAFVSALFLVCALYVKQNTINIPRILDRLNYSAEVTSPTVVFIVFAVVGISLLAVACYLERSRIKTMLITAALFVAGFSVVILPWVWHNSILSGSVLPGMHLTAPNTLTPAIDMFGSKENPDYVLPPELVVDRKDPHCVSSAGTEELDRYWGYQVGWGHYLTLPWRSVMNLDHAGYYVTSQPIILLFPVLLLLPFFWRKKEAWIRWLWLATVFLIVQWSFLANGVIWYGIGMFFGLVLCIETLVAKAPDTLSRTLVSILITLSVLLCLGMRFWQYETQRNLFEYAIGKVSYEAMRERTIPHYDDITDVVLERYETMTDRPLLYRIGTFMPYFIPRNLEVIGITDHQLDTFNCLHQERDPALTIQRIKALGFNSMVFDTNTATIERDPNGSLHQKVNALVDFLNSPEAGMQMVINDPSAGIVFLLIP